MNKVKELKKGVILSYALILANTIYGLLIIPYILQYVGSDAYGVYKSISSISASLAVMDLGLGTTMTRYMARYHATDNKSQAGAFAGMMITQFFVLAIAVISLGIFIYFSMPNAYRNTFSDTQLVLARELFVFLILNMVLRMIENLFFGILSGYECFGFSNSIKLLNVIFRYSLILLLMPVLRDVRILVYSETVLVTITIVVFVLYVYRKIRIKPKFMKWDRALFRESFGYTLLMFIQSITVQFNGNIDNILLGMIQGPIIVTVYSMALTIFGMYENLSGSIANIMLPHVTSQVIAGSDSTVLQKTVEKSGRFQFVLLAAALGGFISLGKYFYILWLGEGYTDCYLLVLMLIVPVTFPMMQNVALSILRANNQMGYRTITLFISCFVNALITYFGIHLWGYWGAALGTGCATCLNVVLMNYYYHKTLHFKICRMFINITKGILPAACVATIITFLMRKLVYCTWGWFIALSIVYLAIYIFGLLVFGLQEEEKSLIFGRIVRRKK